MGRIAEFLRNWWFGVPSSISYSFPAKTIWGRIHRWVNNHLVFVLLIFVIATNLMEFSQGGQLRALVTFFAFWAWAGWIDKRG